MLCWGGLKLPNLSTKASNACSIGASTTIDVRTAVSVAWMLTSLLLARLLGDGLVRRERLFPEPLELRAQLRQPVGIDAVDALPAGLPVDHQPGVLQDPQVLRHGGSGDREPSGELANRVRAADEPLEDGSPGRIRECGPCARRVSLH